MADAQLVCGLGNGLLYRRSRHGVGARLVEQLATEHSATWQLYPTLAAWVAELDTAPACGAPASAAAAAAAEAAGGADAPEAGGTTPAISTNTGPVFLLWALGPYNCSGWTVAAAARRFGVAVPGGVTIVHDDRASGAAHDGAAATSPILLSGC